MSSRCRSATPTPARRPMAAVARMAAALVPCLLACQREEPNQTLPAAVAAHEGGVLRTSDIRAGGASPDVAVANPYGDDPIAAADGRQLYGAMNCAGCHGGAGGGGIGPPLADAEWIYGGQPENVVQSILQGRPNGMPAFGGKLPPAEAWKIAAYVATLAAAGAKQAPAQPTVGGRGGRSGTAGR